MPCSGRRYFQKEANLKKVRNVVCSYVWEHLSVGYSQGMCDLLSPLLVVLEEEALTHACYLKLMESAIDLFPPNTSMNTRLANVQALLQVRTVAGTFGDRTVGKCGVERVSATSIYRPL